jgi:hypothetical protein
LNTRSLAFEHSLDRGLHVIVDAAGTDALEEHEGPVVGVEHHLLALARVCPHEQHPAVTEPDLGDFDHRRHPVQDDDLMAPIELVSLARRETQRDVGSNRTARCPPLPRPRIAPDSVVATRISLPLQRLENQDQCQLLTARLAAVRLQQIIQRRLPGPELAPGLNITLVRKRRLARPQHLADRVARDLQITGDLLDRPPLNIMRAPDPANRLHYQHPPHHPSAK